jgi:hypothetical protein
MKARELKKGEVCCQHLRYVGVHIWQDEKRGNIVATYQKDEMCFKVTKESKEETESIDVYDCS